MRSLKLVIILLIISTQLASYNCDLEKNLNTCCKFGTQWGLESKNCKSLTRAIEGIPPEELSVCLSVVEICCIRTHRDTQCELGKQAAEQGLDCIISSNIGGEYQKDCCDSCKLGIVSASMGIDCDFQDFQFGQPWDNAYQNCCIEFNSLPILKSTTPKSLSNENSNEIEKEKPYIEVGTCPNGFYMNVTSKFCDDIDECELNLDNCSENTTCINIIGSFVCATPSEKACIVGYEYSESLNSCIDINECERNPCKSKRQICINTDGSYYCKPRSSRQCPPGFGFNVTQRVCQDIDECLQEDTLCSAEKPYCQNTLGSFVCLAFTNEDEEDLDTDTETYKEDMLNCKTGYRLSLARNGTLFCADINECIEDPFKCNGSICINFDGGYKCEKRLTEQTIITTPMPTTTSTTTTEKDITCNKGFRVALARNGTLICSDVNECIESPNICHGNICENTEGSFLCKPKPTTATSTTTTTTTEIPTTTFKIRTTSNRPTITTPKWIFTTKKSIVCPLGYKFNDNDLRCDDINECTEHDNVCDSHQQCINTIGSFRCICKSGFKLNPELNACVDINECQSNLHNCQSSQRCDNTIGSFHCIRFTSCGTGYTLNANSGYCEDDDECALRTHNCDELGPLYQCKNTLGSFRCQKKRCEFGQILLENGECAAFDCPTGYKANEKGQCTDINECEIRASNCLSNEKCINTIGSYTCSSLLDCGRGYEVNSEGNQCIDIDECRRNLHTCGANQVCMNKIGSFSCQCPPGHSFNNLKQCVDIDECSLFRGKLQVCSSNSECRNTQGSFMCTCKEGFVNDVNDNKICTDIDECNSTVRMCDHTCINVWGSFRCSCNSGFLLQPDNRSCRDMDECDEFKDRTLCVGVCRNTPGSYRCECPNGYRMGSDERTCIDIDECAAGNACRRQGDVCLNTRGSYHCFAVDCPPNYIRETEHKNRCKKTNYFCKADDIECANRPQTLSFNYITFVSNMQIPNVGFLDLFTMRGPMWNSAHVSFHMDLAKVYSNRPSVTLATLDYFRLRRPAHNQAIISLVKSIQGPQEIELKITMKMYYDGVFGGNVVASLFIVVSQYEF